MDTRERVIKCIKRIKDEEFTQEDNLISSGWLDSFGLIKLIKELEEEFSLKIPIAEILPETFDSIKEISNMIEIIK